MCKKSGIEIKKTRPEWVNSDQTGFVPGKEGRNNSIRTMLMLQEGKKNTTPVN